MKRFAFASFLSAALVPNAALAERVFFGLMTFTNVANCNNIGTDDPSHSTFHPRLPDNDDFAGLTHVNQFGGAGYQLNGADFNSSFQLVEAHGLGWSGYDITGAAVRISSQVPATIDASTTTLRLTGQIKSPFGDPGNQNGPCVVTFKAVYVAKNS